MRQNVSAQRPNGQYLRQYLRRMDQVSEITRQAPTHERHTGQSRMSFRIPVVLIAVALLAAPPRPSRAPMQHDTQGMAPGGLAELTPRGEVVRQASAATLSTDRRIRPYSAAILPNIDRVVVSTTDLDNGDTTRTLQFWRLSDLSVQHTIELPSGPRGDEGYRSEEPRGPRVLRAGKSVLVSTFNCGLYLLNDIAGTKPGAQLVASFPRKPGLPRTSCAVPAVVGNYYLITVPAWSAVVSLDVSDPSHPREVSRVTLGPDDVPHWIGIEPNSQRVVITGYQGMRTRIVIARFDERTGMLTLDERFRAAGSTETGLRMEGIAWPHGGRGAAVPHGAVFSRP